MSSQLPAHRIATSRCSSHTANICSRPQPCSRCPALLGVRRRHPLYTGVAIAASGHTTLRAVVRARTRDSQTTCAMHRRVLAQVAAASLAPIVTATRAQCRLQLWLKVHHHRLHGLHRQPHTEHHGRPRQWQPGLAARLAAVQVSPRSRQQTTPRSSSQRHVAA